MVQMIENLNTSLDELKEQNARLTQIITQQNEELRVLHEKHDEEYIFRSMPTQFRAILN
jgi:FtsZ-binding cell division protein ZapB